MKRDLSKPDHLKRLQSSQAKEDLPGLGEFYCVECAKYFEGPHNLLVHRKGKNHKRRVRLLKQEVHSQEAAEAAVGLGVDNGRRAEQDGDSGAGVT